MIDLLIFTTNMDMVEDIKHKLIDDTIVQYGPTHYQKKNEDMKYLFDAYEDDAYESIVSTVVYAKENVERGTQHSLLQAQIQCGFLDDIGYSSELFDKIKKKLKTYWENNAKYIIPDNEEIECGK